MMIMQHLGHYHKGSLDCAKPKHNLRNNVLQVWATLVPVYCIVTDFRCLRWLFFDENASAGLVVGKEYIVCWLHKRILTIDQMMVGMWKAEKELIFLNCLLSSAYIFKNYGKCLLFPKSLINSCLFLHFGVWFYKVVMVILKFQNILWNFSVNKVCKIFFVAYSPWWRLCNRTFCTSQKQEANNGGFNFIGKKYSMNLRVISFISLFLILSSVH